VTCLRDAISWRRTSQSPLSISSSSRSIVIDRSQWSWADCTVEGPRGQYRGRSALKNDPLLPEGVSQLSRLGEVGACQIGLSQLPVIQCQGSMRTGLSRSTGAEHFSESQPITAPLFRAAPPNFDSRRAPAATSKLRVLSRRQLLLTRCHDLNRCRCSKKEQCIRPVASRSRPLVSTVTSSSNVGQPLLRSTRPYSSPSWAMSH
jgi:hypothetical protein